tara:strand:+ start:2449 stop:4185 length:1737 start_codon:yes stop_codon:yes gene_type:complete
MDSRTNTLEQVIFKASTNQIKIPKYQRPYSWETQQIDEFWDDLIQENPTFFIGPIIINIEYKDQDDGYVEVVDGQQRLITSTILAAVIRDTYKEFGADSRANNIQRNFIAYVDDDDNDKGFRLIPGLSTSDFFKNNIQSANSDIMESEPDTKEHKRIKDNYKNFKNTLDKHLSSETSNDAKIEKIGKIRDRLKKLIVIIIEINNDNEAYEIFERVNNYGIDLSLSDLLKNHILKNSNNTDAAHSIWYEVEKNIRTAESEMKKFIRYHWLSKYNFRTEKKLYNSIKDEIRNYDAFLDELQESSEIFNKILKGDRQDFNNLKINGRDFSKKIYSIIIASRYMGISQDNVFYLGLIRNIEKNKILVNPSNFLEFLEKFLFKYFAVCTLPANKVERLFSKYSIELEKECNSENTESNIKKNTQRIFNNFKNELTLLIPVKELFIEKFKEIKYSTSEKNRKLINYILGNYEDHLSQNNETMLNFDEINIEHLLPQKPESWGLTKAEIKDYVHNIGNLTLIHRRINSEMGNISLEDKVPKLQRSELRINKQLMVDVMLNGLSWDQEKIENRNTNLANLAYDTIW